MDEATHSTHTRHPVYPCSSAVRAGGVLCSHFRCYVAVQAGAARTCTLAAERSSSEVMPCAAGSGSEQPASTSCTALAVAAACCMPARTHSTERPAKQTQQRNDNNLKLTDLLESG
eukprot:GHRQ01025672.1.p4 GENE.GHRQ01025672.1~~GHRQ01025672.1.p4  ORF type:complete len:116 (-),score=17.44 GHRQ01025672.1:789-1136(-)